jgi:tripartite-type tricarboxylate transporter receptor subunit TctC
MKGKGGGFMDKREKELFLSILPLIIIFILFIGWIDPVQSQQKYPTKPIDLIVGFPPGGVTDTGARVLSIYLEKKWGGRVNVINKPGGNAIPAVLEVIKSIPDGYTLMGDNITSNSMLHIALKDVPFKATDRNMVAIWASTPNAWFVPPDSPFKSLKDVEAEAKRDPENFTWTSLGGPSPQDFCMKQFFRAIGVDVSKTKPVICKGGAQVIVMTAGGHVKLGFTGIATTLPAAKAGNVKVIAVTCGTRSRWPDFPDIPTTQELGYHSITFVGWNGISGPLHLPPFVIETWNKALQEMTQDADMISRMRNIGMEPYFLNSEEAREFVLKEIEEGKKMWTSK